MAPSTSPATIVGGAGAVGALVVVGVVGAGDIDGLVVAMSFVSAASIRSAMALSTRLSYWSIRSWPSAVFVISSMTLCLHPPVLVIPALPPPYRWASHCGQSFVKP